MTRGDGSRGEEITNNVKSMKSVPLYADFSKLGIKTIELRGEALISTSNFTKINKLREENGQVLFANARNAATGGLRTKDPKETESRKMDAFIYSISYAADENGQSKLDEFKSHYESIDTIGKLGVKVPTEARKLCKGIDEVVKFCAKWQNDRNLFPYEIDGIVIKLDNKNWQDRIGFTAHHPRWAIAYKFQAKQGATRLIDVEYQIGKIGSVTPVGKLEPVALAGVTISQFLLHKKKLIKKVNRIWKLMLVKINGEDVDIPEGSTIKLSLIHISEPTRPY